MYLFFLIIMFYEKFEGLYMGKLHAIKERRKRDIERYKFRAAQHRYNIMLPL